MRKRRGSPGEPPPDQAPREEVHPSEGYGPNILWLNALAGWVSDAHAASWSGPKPEMIAAALTLSEIAAHRAKRKSVVN
jgi:hypothetical protein